MTTTRKIHLLVICSICLFSAGLYLSWRHARAMEQKQEHHSEGK
jgi:hypothetical protein